MCVPLVLLPSARTPLWDKVIPLEARALQGRGSVGPQDWHCMWLLVLGSKMGL